MDNCTLMVAIPCCFITLLPSTESELIVIAAPQCSQELGNANACTECNKLGS